MTEKYIGYSLLGVGILLMIFATIQIIFVFTGKAEPISLFTTEQTPQTAVQQDQQLINPEDLMAQLQSGDYSSLFSGSGTTGIPGFEFIDPASLNRILNLTIYYFIMQFLLSLGYKLSSLGVTMLRPLKVEVIQKRLEEAMPPRVQQQ